MKNIKARNLLPGLFFQRFPDENCNLDKMSSVKEDCKEVCFTLIKNHYSKPLKFFDFDQ